MIALANMTRIVRIGNEVKPIRKIQYPGCLTAARRGSVACVADKHHYALLDVVNQQKIPLFPISSLDSTPAPLQTERIPVVTEQREGRRGSSSNVQRLGGGHARQSSLGTFMAGLAKGPLSPRPQSRDPPGLSTPDIASPAPASPRGPSPQPTAEVDKPLPDPPAVPEQQQVEAEPPATELLTPHVVSPSPTEYLLTTGTGSKEPSVGMFVNADGDVVRGTIQFEQYPTSIAVDNGQSQQESGLETADSIDEGYILVSFAKEAEGRLEAGIEVQRWDVLGANKAWMPFPAKPSATEEDVVSSADAGVSSVYTDAEINMAEITGILKTKRLTLPSSTQTTTGDDMSNPEIRDTGDEEFSRRLGQRKSRLICWSGRTLYWLVRSPLLMQLEDSLASLTANAVIDRAKLAHLVATVQNREAKSEAEFLSLVYTRQKLSLILFEDIATGSLSVNPEMSEQLLLDNHLLLDSRLDPRVILSMISLSRTDIDEGTAGVTLYQGLVTRVEKRLTGLSISVDSDEVLSRPGDYDIAAFVKRYLYAWRGKKGYGSIANEEQVFASVDAALLHLLLHQDQQSSLGPGRSPTLRAELYSVVDHGISCFERAVRLLEDYKRLYALSRLYQSRKMAGKVLDTWRRITEGEGDEGSEFLDRENQIRKYVVKIRDPNLVEEYGTWLAKRNATLGVQVFTDDQSIVKLPPNQVVQLLQLRAPDAVKVYLEHLVFGKKNFRYADNLISYYLTSVLSVLASDDPHARDILTGTYEQYRALQPPKPTYRQFITDNAPRDLPWWNDRARLLELLGGTFGTDFDYDVPTVLTRLQPYVDYLVPEGIILDGRQGRHEQALRLLCHGLGDYHTAINYCLLGGASIFYPAMPGSSSISRVRSQHEEGEQWGIPDMNDQKILFSALIKEFLALRDESQRQELVGNLLGRFAAWFDIEQVLPLVPEHWPIEILEPFIVSALRVIVHEKAEAMIVKALSGAENIIVANKWVEKCEAGGAIVIREEGRVST